MIIDTLNLWSMQYCKNNAKYYFPCVVCLKIIAVRVRSRNYSSNILVYGPCSLQCSVHEILCEPYSVIYNSHDTFPGLSDPNVMGACDSFSVSGRGATGPFFYGGGGGASQFLTGGGIF